MANSLVNQSVSQARSEFVPSSVGGKQAKARRPHPFSHTRTSTFGSRAD
ncbi:MULTISPECIES: hypothetical protein [unclassified Pseudoalteromonas]|nr:MULTISPECIES: hypothetical protein [unclassified Pseudoalteromonas]